MTQEQFQATIKAAYAADDAFQAACEIAGYKSRWDMSAAAKRGAVTYIVAIVIRNKFMSDHKRFPTFAAARRYQAVVRETNKRKYDTAIIASDNRVLNYLDEELLAIA